MLTYESLVTLLLSGAEQTGLNIQFSQEQLDPHSMTRTFTLTCLPSGVREPRLNVPFATLSFTWDSALTALSVLGSDALCDMYHAPKEHCIHHDDGCAYEAMLDLNVVYDIPLSEEQRLNLAGIPVLARSVQALTAPLSRTKLPLDIDVQIQFTSSYQAFVGQVSGRQQWTLDSHLHDEDELREEMNALSQELRLTLNALAEFSPPSDEDFEDFDFDEFMLDESSEDLLDLQTYLRPPAA